MQRCIKKNQLSFDLKYNLTKYKLLRKIDSTWDEIIYRGSSGFISSQDKFMISEISF